MKKMFLGEDLKKLKKKTKPGFYWEKIITKHKAITVGSYALRAAGSAQALAGDPPSPPPLTTKCEGLLRLHG